MQKDISIQEKEYRHTSLGHALYIVISTPDYRQLSWSEVWEAFAARYPGRWAVQFFPPAEELVDERNLYHLFVLEEAPRGVNVKATRKMDR
jgi:hypothetical protein